MAIVPHVFFHDQPMKPHRDTAVIFQHPSAPVILAVPTPDSIAYAKAKHDEEQAAAHRAMDAFQRCRDAGVPRQLLDLFLVDGIDRTLDWVELCVIELGGRK